MAFHYFLIWLLTYSDRWIRILIDFILKDTGNRSLLFRFPVGEYLIGLSIEQIGSEHASFLFFEENGLRIYRKFPAFS